MKKESAQKKQRLSGIELLKIVGILLVIVSHVVETLNNPNPYISYQDYIVPLGHATKSVSKLLLALLRYCGDFGNMIFFACSAWFLLDSQKVNKKKILQMILDVWMISFCFVVVIVWLRHGNVSKGLLLKQFFPILFENNWYITCYILFYAIHPFLNWILEKMDQKLLLKTDLILMILYGGINYVHHTHYFANALIYWIVIYFVIAYVKRYLTTMQNDKKKNIKLFLFGLICHCLVVILTNFFGLHIGAFENKVMKWQSYCSPFILCQVIGLLNLARNEKFVSKFVNTVSSLSLFVYVIHENMLLRTYYRPLWWHMIYNTFGYRYILLWVLLMVLVLAVVSMLLAWFYKISLQHVTTKMCGVMYQKLGSAYHKIESKLIKYQ